MALHPECLHEIVNSACVWTINKVETEKENVKNNSILIIKLTSKNISEEKLTEYHIKQSKEYAIKLVSFLNINNSRHFLTNI